jgi:hypothetical protein
MTIEQLLNNRIPGKMVCAGNWRSLCHTDDDGRKIVTVYHYATEMIQFYARPKHPDFPVAERFISHVDLGHGSKSDQDGMNRIFRKLGLSWYYSRKGGSAQIIDLLQDPESTALPKYLRDPEIRRSVYGYSS